MHVTNGSVRVGLIVGVVLHAGSSFSDDGKLPTITLADAVNTYLKQNARFEEIGSFEGRYQVTQYRLVEPAEGGGRPLPLAQPVPRVLPSGLFGVAKDLMAVDADGQHAVFDGSTTKKYSAGAGFGSHVKRCGTPLCNDWVAPSSMFDRFYDRDRTRISRILKDAITEKRLGKSRLAERAEKVKSEWCYVVEGGFDVAKLRGQPEPLPDKKVDDQVAGKFYIVGVDK